MTEEKKQNEILHFALRNGKLRVGAVILLVFIVLTFIGPLLTPYKPDEFVAAGATPPSAEHWFGTTTFGEDVFTQLMYGLKATFLVGIIGGGLGTILGVLVGFIAGYRGGIVDEALNMLTNIVLVIPTLAVLLIIAAYLRVRGIVTESVFIALTAWPWAARAIRAQTFSLRSRDFVDLARLSGMKSLKIIFTEIAPNMMSYLLLVFILQFGGAILTAATLDFIGLGPTTTISLGLMMNMALLWSALMLGMWWWFVPPGLVITAIVGALYIMNVGLDEVLTLSSERCDAVSLQVEDLTIYYQTLRGDVRALEHATFNVADGEIMGLAGESGCGKSTLCTGLIMLAPPMKLVKGCVTLDDENLPLQDMERMNAFRFRRVSIVPQYAMNALNPTRKIGRMTEELLTARKADFKAILPELKRRLDLVKLPHEVLDRYPIELSGGMKQRMVMVLSTLLNPSLLIADEITSALDVSTQKAVSEMLVAFRDRGFVKSVIVITHDISILYQIADSIMVMYAGQLAEKAPTETIICAPRHPYTRLLISALPEVGARCCEKRLIGIPGNPPLLLNPPAGCRFRERCPVAFEKCSEEPPFLELDKGHFVACWREC